MYKIDKEDIAEINFGILLILKNKYTKTIIKTLKNKETITYWVKGSNPKINIIPATKEWKKN